ncbi:hypothetical protein B0H19DRAFT_1183422 [Mycena capillaripes]|nr:hypothetical protein B0H19DRAFT_1183422 [Mycena capillaripes]
MEGNLSLAHLPRLQDPPPIALRLLHPRSVSMPFFPTFPSQTICAHIFPGFPPYSRFHRKAQCVNASQCHRLKSVHQLQRVYHETARASAEKILPPPLALSVLPYRLSRFPSTGGSPYDRSAQYSPQADSVCRPFTIPHRTTPRRSLAVPMPFSPPSRASYLPHRRHSSKPSAAIGIRSSLTISSAAMRFRRHVRHFPRRAQDTGRTQPFVQPQSNAHFPTR